MTYAVRVWKWLWKDVTLPLWVAVIFFLGVINNTLEWIF